MHDHSEMMPSNVTSADLMWWVATQGGMVEESDVLANGGFAYGNAAALGFVAGAWATHLCWCIGHEVPGWPGYIAQAAGGANIEERTHLCTCMAGF